MSRQSKAERDARRKQQPKTQGVRRPPSLPVHARIAADDAVVGGAVLEKDEWVMLLHGQTVTSTDSAAMMLAMLRHTASDLEGKGHDVRLDYSIHLRDIATAEAEGEGKTLEEYLGLLEAERKERRERQGAPEAADLH